MDTCPAICPRTVDHADCAAVVPQQDALRWPGCLRPPSQRGPGGTRPRRRGVLRPALSRGPRPAGPADRGAQPGPLPRARSVPGPAPAARSATRIDALELATMWTAGFPRAANLQPAGGAAAGSHGATSSTWCTTTSAWAPACWTSPQRPAGGGHRAPSDHPRPRPRSGGGASGGAEPLVRRWYGFAEMQKRVARRIPDLLTVSSSSAADIAEDFGVRPEQLHVVPLGVDTDLFAPPTPPGCPGRIIADLVRPTGRSRASATCCRRSPGCAADTISTCSWWPGSSPTARPRS